MDRITVVDPLTLRVELKEPWTSFQYTLSTEAGMIPSPTSLRQQCVADQPIRDCPFNLNAVGAGAFMLESFKPNDSITLVRNPNYWGGEVYLDRLVFVNFGDGGGEQTWSALQTGSVQGAY